MGWTILRNGLYAELLAGLAPLEAAGSLPRLVRAVWHPLRGRIWPMPRYG
jgi:hypothetical protein